MTSERNGIPNDRPVRVLLLENVHPAARDLLAAEGLEVELQKNALGPDELASALQDFDVLGIRSKTHVTAEVIEKAPHLLALGCFCIGTNQVDLTAANRRGVPVFNAPFSNTRSVAELMIGEIISLARQLPERSREVHAGRWNKVASHCFEVRGKTLGIVGYGHIGSQLGVLAEGLGMRVLFHDVAVKLPMGNNRSVSTLAELLAQSDFVSLHVPATAQTHRMIDHDAISLMRPGSYLLNASRGTVVDVEALAEALKSGHLAGAAVDVYPDEPESNSDGFDSPLRGLPNVILTPHIGGSTEEAQEAIGREVGTSLARFLRSGATPGAVNFPHADLPMAPGRQRIVNVHRNQPGVLRDINRIVSDLHANIEGQFLATDPHIGYLLMDVGQDVSAELLKGISALPASIRTRILA